MQQLLLDLEDLLLNQETLRSQMASLLVKAHEEVLFPSKGKGVKPNYWKK